MSSLQKRIRETFTEEDFNRNLKYMLEKMSPEEMYDLYELCFFHTSGEESPQVLEYRAFLQEQHDYAKQRQYKGEKPSGFMRGLACAQKGFDDIFEQREE